MLLKGLVVLVLLTLVKGSIANVSETWEAANKVCEERGSHLPIITAQNNMSTVVKMMKNLGISRTWLAIRKSTNGTWIWFDGKPAADDFTKVLWMDNMDCGFYHLRDQTIEAGRCSSERLGYLCEDKGNRSCAAMTVPVSNCSRVHGRTFVYLCGAANWYDARRKCLDLGTELGVIKLESLMSRLGDKWYHEKSESCMELWIGLRRNEWLYDNSNKKEKTIPNYWAKGEPSEKGHCAVISQDFNNGQYRWYAERCTSKKSYMCWPDKEPLTIDIPTIKDMNVQTGDQTPASTKSDYRREGGQNPNRGGSKSVGRVVGAVCGAIGILAVILFVAGKCARRKRERKRQYVSGRRFLDMYVSDRSLLEMDTRIEPDPFQQLQEAGFSACDIRQFDFKGGQLLRPNSKISLNIPNNAIPDDATCHVGCKIRKIIHNRCFVPNGEIIICPVTEFRAIGIDEFYRTVTVTIPHNISKQSIQKQIKLYHWDNEILSELGKDTRQGSWFEVQENVIHIHTARVGTFISTCNILYRPYSGNCCVLTFKYNEFCNKSQELVVEVYLLNKIYAMEDFIMPQIGGTLASEFKDYVLPPAFQMGEAMLQLKFSSPEIEYWDIVNSAKSKDCSFKEVRLTELDDSLNEGHALILLGCFEVSRMFNKGGGMKRDSMLINLDVSVTKNSSDEMPQRLFFFKENLDFEKCQRENGMEMDDQSNMIT